MRDPATTDWGALATRLADGLRPLTRISYALDAHAFGMHAGGFLATNLALHVGTSLLVFALARRRLDVTCACIAALVFALQPAHGEVVAYVSGRSTGLMTPLLLAGLLCHDRGRRLGAIACFVLACLAKEVALVFPALVLVWDATSGRSWRGAVIYAVIACALFGALLLLGAQRALVADVVARHGVTDALFLNGRAVPTMLSLWVRPFALSVDHDTVPGGSVVEAGVLVVVLAASLLLSRRAPAWSLAVAWALVALLPTSSIVAKVDLVTEKPLYLAWVGPAIAIGWGFARLRSRVAAAVLISVLAVTSAWRAYVWSDPVRLWEEAVAHAPTKARCWNNLGMAYRAAGRPTDAAAAFRHAVMLDPLGPQPAFNLLLTNIKS